MHGHPIGGNGFREINVTPLVDVMLVLLVVFMVTAPLLAASLPVELPRVGGSANHQTADPLTLTVTHDGRILLGDTDVSDHPEDSLRDRMRASAGPVVVRADRATRYEAVARAVAAARSAGAERVDLVVEPEARAR